MNLALASLSSPEKAAGPAPLWRRAGPQRALLLVCTLVLTLRSIDRGGFRFTDAARHGMSGVYLLDMLREGGWRHPIAFSHSYYAHYPSLGIPYHYPPLFHAVEACCLAVGGISAVTTRVTVLLFHLLGAWLLYEVVRAGGQPSAALWSAWFYVASPVVLFWSRQTMLEAPSVAMMLLAARAWQRVVERPSAARNAYWAISLLACLATKQTTVIVLPAHLLAWGLLPTDQRRALRSLGWAAAIVGLSAVVGALLAARFAPATLGSLVAPVARRLTAEHVLRFPSIIDFLCGWTIVVLLLMGLWSVWRRAELQAPAALWIAWFWSFYLVQICLTGERARYGVLWVPPLAYFAAQGVLWLASSAPWKRAAPVAALLLVSMSLYRATTEPAPWITGTPEAAQLVASLPGGDAILVDGIADGDMVFHCRRYDPQKRFILRGSKALYAYASYKHLGYTPFVTKKEDIEQALRRFGVRYLVIENIDAVHTPPGRMLRQLVRTQRFQRIARVPIAMSHRRLSFATAWEIYEYLDAQPATAETIRLEFPGLKQVIEVPFSRAAGAAPMVPVPRSPALPGAASRRLSPAVFR